MGDLPEGRRVVVTEWGETPMEALERFVRLEPQAPPDPAGLGPNDVLLRVRSCAVGWVDLIMASGQYQHMANPPYTPGLEFAGDVVWTGAEVGGVRAGDAVLADGLATGPRSSGAYQRWGGFATWAVVPQHAALPLPEGLSYDQAVNLLGNYETAYHALVHRGRLVAGETVLVNGATGSTGLAAVHVAKMVGAKVIATGRDPDKLAQVQEQGADHVLAVGDGAGGVRPFRDEAKALTGGKGVHVVYDGVGGPISLESIRALRFGGRFCIVGWAATPFVASGKGRRGDAPQRCPEPGPSHQRTHGEQGDGYAQDKSALGETEHHCERQGWGGKAIRDAASTALAEDGYSHQQRQHPPEEETDAVGRPVDGSQAAESLFGSDDVDAKRVLRQANDSDDDRPHHKEIHYAPQGRAFKRARTKHHVEQRGLEDQDPQFAQSDVTVIGGHQRSDRCQHEEEDGCVHTIEACNQSAFARSPRADLPEAPREEAE